MELTGGNAYLVVTLICLAPLVVFFAFMDSEVLEDSEVRTAGNNMFSTASLVGMAVIFFSYRSDIFYAAHSNLLL